MSPPGTAVQAEARSIVSRMKRRLSSRVVQRGRRLVLDWDCVKAGGRQHAADNTPRPTYVKSLHCKDKTVHVTIFGLPARRRPLDFTAAGRLRTGVSYLLHVFAIHHFRIMFL